MSFERNTSIFVYNTLSCKTLCVQLPAVCSMDELRKIIQTHSGLPAHLCLNISGLKNSATNSMESKFFADQLSGIKSESIELREKNLMIQTSIFANTTFSVQAGPLLGGSDDFIKTTGSIDEAKPSQNVAVKTQDGQETQKNTVSFSDIMTQQKTDSKNSGGFGNTTSTSNTTKNLGSMNLLAQTSRTDNATKPGGLGALLGPSASGGGGGGGFGALLGPSASGGGGGGGFGGLMGAGGGEGAGAKNIFNVGFGKALTTVARKVEKKGGLAPTPSLNQAFDENFSVATKALLKKVSDQYQKDQKEHKDSDKSDPGLQKLQIFMKKVDSKVEWYNKIEQHRKELISWIFSKAYEKNPAKVLKCIDNKDENFQNEKKAFFQLVQLLSFQHYFKVFSVVQNEEFFDEITEDQSELLQYMRSLKNMKLAAMMAYSSQKPTLQQFKLDLSNRFQKLKKVNEWIVHLKMTSSSNLQALLMTDLKAKDVKEIFTNLSDDRQQINLAFHYICLCKESVKEELLGIMDDEMKDRLQTWQKIIDVKGISYTIAKDNENKHVGKTTHYKRNFRQEVSQMREFSLPQDPVVLDEIQRINKILTFVRIEVYDHGCDTAYIIKDFDHDEIIENNKLRKGFRLSIYQYTAENQSRNRTFQKAILEPIAFYRSQQTVKNHIQSLQEATAYHFGKRYLLQGCNNYIFWFCITDDDDIQLKTLSKNQNSTPKTQIVGQNSVLKKFLLHQHGLKISNQQNAPNKFTSVLPRMVKHNKQKLIVFQSNEGPDPSVIYFYDVNFSREIVKVSNAIAFIQIYDHLSDSSLQKSHAVFYTKVKKSEELESESSQLIDDKDDGQNSKLSDDDYRVMCCPIDFAEAYKQASGITEVDLHRDHRISAALDITQLKYVDKSKNKQKSQQFQSFVHGAEILPLSLNDGNMGFVVCINNSVAGYSIGLSEGQLSISKIFCYEGEENEQVRLMKDENGLRTDSLVCTNTDMNSMRQGQCKSIIKFLQYKADDFAINFETKLKLRVCELVGFVVESQDQYFLGIKDKRGIFQKLHLQQQPSDIIDQRDNPNLKISLTEQHNKSYAQENNYVTRSITKDHINSWQAVVDYPLVCLFNYDRPQEFMIINLVDERRDAELLEGSKSKPNRVLFQFWDKSICRVEQIETALQTHQSQFAFILAQERNQSATKTQKAIKESPVRRNLNRTSFKQVGPRNSSPLKKSPDRGRGKASPLKQSPMKNRGVNAGVTNDDGQLSFHQQRTTQIQLQVFSMLKPFVKGAINDKKYWNIEPYKQLNLNFDVISDERYFIRSVIVIIEPITKVTCIVYSTDQKIELICNEHIESLVTDDCFQFVSNIKPVRGNSGNIYFIEKEVRTQTLFLVEAKIKFDKKYKEWRLKKRQVFTFLSEIFVLQMVREDHEADVFEYRLNGEKCIDADENYPKDQLYILNAKLELIKIQQTVEKRVYKEIQRTSLGHFEAIKNWVKDLEDLNSSDIQVPKNCLVDNLYKKQSICFSDRAVVLKDTVYAIQSGKKYSLNEFVGCQKGQLMRGTQIVPQSDQLMTAIATFNQKGSIKDLKLLFINDPGRRNRSVVGARHLTNILSVHTISNQLLLMRFGISYENSYWSIINYEGFIMIMQPQFSNILHQEQTVWQEPQTCFKKGYCQILLYEIDDDQGDLPQLWDKKSKKQFSKAYLLRLSSKSELMDSQHTIAEPNSQKWYSRVELFQNYRGDVLQIFVRSDDQSSVSAPQYSENKKNLIPAALSFSSAQQGTQFVYLYDYFCWMMPSTNSEIPIKFVHIKDQKEKVIKLQSFLDCDEDIPIHMISIEACSPIKMAKGSRSGVLSDQAIEKFGNCLQVTVSNRVLIFDMSLEEPVPIEDLSSTEILIDPQRFVEGTIQLATVKERHTKKQIIKTQSEFTTNRSFYRVSTASFKNNQQVQQLYDESNVKCQWIPVGLKQSLESTQFGNLVLHQQQMKCMEVQQKNNIRFRRVLGIYGECAVIDFLELESLTKTAKKGRRPDKVEIDTIFCQFQDETLFYLIRDYETISIAIYDNLEKQNYSDIEDIDGQTVHHPNLQRLSNILLKNTLLVQKRDKRTQKLELYERSFLRNQLHKSSVRDALLKIGRLSQAFSVFDCFYSQKCLNKMMTDCTVQAIEELNNCMQETSSTRKITSVSWPSKRRNRMFTLRSDKCIILAEGVESGIMEAVDSNKSCKCKIGSEQAITSNHVKVRMLDMHWFYQGQKSFVDFAELLEEKPDDVFSSELIKCLASQFWKPMKQEIIKYGFAPYFVMMFMQITLMFLSVNQESLQDGYEREGYAKFWVVLCFIVCPPLLGLHIFREYYQFKEEDKWYGYFCGFWNWFDFIGLSFSVIIDFIIMTRHDLMTMRHLRGMSAIASFALLAKLYDWLRLFETTSFYIELIRATLFDIAAFMILFATAIFLTGIPAMMVQLDPAENYDDRLGFTDAVKHFSFEQYMQGIGEYSLDDGGVELHNLYYLLFFISTFYVQITMLNMLIALMNDTYSKVSSQKEISSMKTKIKLISEKPFSLSVNNTNEVETDVFMFVVTPSHSQETKSDSIEQKMKKGIQAIKREMRCNIAALQTSMDENASRAEQKQNETSKNIDKKFEHFDRKLEQFQQTMARINGSIRELSQAVNFTANQKQ